MLFRSRQFQLNGYTVTHDAEKVNGEFVVVNTCAFIGDAQQPPSLRNIFKEIQEDTGTPVPRSGNLERWAHQGVLLLNATLTVRVHNAGSHQGKGWEEFTDAAIRRLAEKRAHLYQYKLLEVFLFRHVEKHHKTLLFSLTVDNLYSI